MSSEEQQRTSTYLHTHIRGQVRHFPTVRHLSGRDYGVPTHQYQLTTKHSAGSKNTPLWEIDTARTTGTIHARVLLSPEQMMEAVARIKLHLPLSHGVGSRSSSLAPGIPHGPPAPASHTDSFYRRQYKLGTESVIHYDDSDSGILSNEPFNDQTPTRSSSSQRWLGSRSNGIASHYSPTHFTEAYGPGDALSTSLHSRTEHDTKFSQLVATTTSGPQSVLDPRLASMSATNSLTGL